MVLIVLLVLNCHSSGGSLGGSCGFLLVLVSLLWFSLGSCIDLVVLLVLLVLVVLVVLLALLVLVVLDDVKN